jgi:chromate reductase
MQILGIAGSIRSASLNRQLLVELQHLVAPTHTLEIAEIADIPHYNTEIDDPNGVTTPASVLRLRHQIHQANVLVIATPEYNHGIPGVLKNALDWASRPFGKSALIGKPVAVIGGGGASGGIRAQVQLRQVLNGSGMHVLTRPEVALRFADVFKDGQLVDTNARDTLQRMIEALVVWHRKVTSD